MKIRLYLLYWMFSFLVTFFLGRKLFQAFLCGVGDGYVEVEFYEFMK